jgi:hypothetical protein
MEFKPPFIDVTSLREDYIYKQHETGLLEKLAYRKRPGTIAICAAIMNKYKVDTVPHLLCGGFTKDETENGLIDLQFLVLKMCWFYVVMPAGAMHHLCLRPTGIATLPTCCSKW